MKPRKLTLSCSLSDVHHHVARIVHRDRDVDVDRTGYTIRASSAFRRYRFTDSATSFRCFGSYQKIAKDCKEDGALLDTLVDARSIKYNRVPLERSMPRDCWCIDIRAAYPTTLMIQGWISSDTYAGAMKLPKIDRLKAVGMLATTKYREIYRNRELADKSRIDNPLRPYFFAACKIVGDHMEEIARENSGGFLWYWVDGIFLRTSRPGRIVDYLAAQGYDATMERVEDVHWSRGRKYLFFTKGGKRTFLCVPQLVSYDAEEVATMIANARDLE